MHTYDTPTPIDLTINLQVGSIEVIASDRTDTIVTVSAGNPEKSSDRRSAEERTTVDFDGRRLTLTGPRPRTSWVGPTRGDSVDVKVELPTGSRFTGEIGVGSLRTVGRLGTTRIKSAHGAVDVDTSGGLWLSSTRGPVTVAVAEGGTEITSDFGQIRLGTVTGDAILRTTHGGIHVDESGGDLDARLSYGNLEITKALASVTASTGWGSIQLGEVSRGVIQIESGLGATIGARPSAPVTIGVRPGVPARLDLESTGGHVRNELADDRASAPSAQTVTIGVRSRGDINILPAQ
jgi:hypothetical protein